VGTFCVGGQNDVDRLTRGCFLDAGQHEHGFDRDFRKQRRRHVRTGGKRLEMALLIRAVPPRSAPSEHLPVVIPGAELLLFPDELVAHAQAAAGGALDDRGRRMGEALGNLLRDVFDVEHGRVVDFFRKRCVPPDAREQFDVAHRGNERAVVLRGKGAVNPIEEAVERDPDVLPRIAGNDPGGRPGNRDQASGDRTALGQKVVDDCQRAQISAEYEDARFFAELYDSIV